MARFILDVGSDDIKNIINDIINHFENEGTFASITCINKTNSSQFHENEKDNKLTKKEIKTFNKNPHS